MPDALSRLIAKRSEHAQKEVNIIQGELEHLSAQGYCVAIESTISDELKALIKEGYEQDKQWQDIIKSLRDLDTPHQTASSEHLFHWQDDLLWYSDDLGRHRICIPKSLEANVFEMAHDDRAHAGFHRTYYHLCSTVYMLRMSKKLREYIHHCPTCALNRTTRHKPFGSLKPILTPSIPGYIVTVDFISALPHTTENEDTLLTVTDKYSKKIELIPGKSTFTAEEWASALVTRSFIAGLGQPSVIISDQDPKFTKEFWQGLYKALGTRLIMTTAYHPSADGQSERTNQIVEIALRHLFFINPQHEQSWTNLLPLLQTQLNNSPSASI